MIDSLDNELLATLAELRQELPSLRFGQLLANLATVARGAEPSAIWDMEDDELLHARWQLSQLAARSAVEAA